MSAKFCIRVYIDLSQAQFVNKCKTTMFSLLSSFLDKVKWRDVLDFCFSTLNPENQKQESC